MRRPGEPDVLDTLGALVDASLVLSADDEPEPRFSMLETVRAYAAERLAASPDRQDRTPPRLWVLGLTAQLLCTQGADYLGRRTRLERERANYRAAVQRLLDAGDLAAMALLVRNAIGYLAFRDAEVEARTGSIPRSRGPGDGTCRAGPAARAPGARGDVARRAGQDRSAAEEGEPLLDRDRYDFDRALARSPAIQGEAWRPRASDEGRPGRGRWCWTGSPR